MTRRHGSLAPVSCSHDVQGGELEPRGMAEHGTWPRNLAAPQALQSRCERRLSPATFRSRCSRTGARMATRCAKRVGGRRVAGEAARGLVLWRMRVDFRGQISWDAPKSRQELLRRQYSRCCRGQSQNLPSSSPVTLLVPGNTVPPLPLPVLRRTLSQCISTS